MRDSRRRGLTYSSLFHVLLVAIIFFGLPNLSPPPPPEPAAISVEILPITGITNVKPSDPAPAPEEKAKAEEKPAPPVQKEIEKAKPAPPVAKDAVPPPPEEKKKADVPKKEEKKPDPKKDEKKKPKAKEDDLAAILKAVKDTAQKEKKAAKSEDANKEAADAEAKKAISNQYNPGLPMSMSERDAIMSQIAPCWNVPAGAKDAQDLIPLLQAQYNEDGSLVSVVVSPETMGRYNSDSFYRAATDAAIRAVKQCQPLKGLPPEKYQTWRMLELNFDPRSMLQ